MKALDWYSAFMLKHDAHPSAQEAEEQGYTTLPLKHLSLDALQQRYFWCVEQCGLGHFFMEYKRGSYIAFEEAADAIAFKFVWEDKWQNQG